MWYFGDRNEAGTTLIVLHMARSATYAKQMVPCKQVAPIMELNPQKRLRSSCTPRPSGNIRAEDKPLIRQEIMPEHTRMGGDPFQMLSHGLGSECKGKEISNMRV